MTGVHLTERDRAVIAATNTFEALKAELDKAVRAGTATPAMLERVNAAAAHLALVSEMPMKFICAHCKGEERCAESHMILHVAAVTFFDKNVLLIGASGEEVRGAYHSIEYGMDRLRKLPVCGECNDEANLHEHLYEAAIDQEADPRRSMQVAIGHLIKAREETLAENERLLDRLDKQGERIEQLESERRELRLRLSGVPAKKENDDAV
jgi:hypothetical protein